MIGKRGIVRILEAFIAIMIISGAMGFIYVNQIQRPNQDDAIHELQRIILEEISNDPVLRAEIVETAITEENEDTPAKDTYPQTDTRISNLISSDYEYEFRVCKLNELCKIELLDGREIYSQEITISSTLQAFDPKVVRLFIWEK